MNRDIILGISTEQTKLLPYTINSMAVNWAQIDLNRPKGTPFNILMYCISGSGYVIDDKIKYSIKPGDLFVWRSDTPNYYINEGDSDWSVNWISFTGKELPLFMSHSFFMTSSCPKEVCAAFFDTIKRHVLDKSVSGQLKASALLFSFLSEMNIYHKECIANDHAFDLQAVVNYMHHNVDKVITLEELSGLFNLSSSYLCRLFNKIYETTPIQYFIAIKMNEAKALLLADNNYSIGEIAGLCGYLDQVYFTRVFKKQVGMTPTAYKKSQSFN